MENPLMLYLVTAAVAAALGYGIARLQDRFRLTSAQSRVGEITTQARREAENILKESELKAKDELFHKREEFNREMEKARARFCFYAVTGWRSDCAAPHSGHRSGLSRRS